MVITQTENKEVVEGKLIPSILKDYLKEGHAVSLWRLPNSNRKNILICTDGPKLLDEVVIEELQPGFVVAPFNATGKKVYLKANHVYALENDQLIQNAELPVNQNKPNEPNVSAGKTLNFFRRSCDSCVPSNKVDFLNLVSRSIGVIEDGRIEKIVPSRNKSIKLSEEFDILKCFERLCETYPNAFVSLVSSAYTGTWIGASPELLVSVDHHMHFKTAAVAGTQILPESADLRQIAWTQKEIEEQALVSRYIINCFKKIRLREFSEHGPKTWQAGNLLHLKTDFEVDMTATNFPQLGSVMLKLLHPTSAVCGMPREESIDFLKNHEQMDREFYSGFLGPVNFQNESHLFVNLRCMQWTKNEAILYAGAGVTVDSIPEKEWEETEMKMNTLLNVIGS